MRRARAEVKLTKYDAAANDTEDDHKDREQTSSCICLFVLAYSMSGPRNGCCRNSVPHLFPRSDEHLQTNDFTLGCQTCDSASSSIFHHLALLVALVSYSSNFHHWPLLALLVALGLH